MQRKWKICMYIRKQKKYGSYKPQMLMALKGVDQFCLALFQANKRKALENIDKNYCLLGNIRDNRGLRDKERILDMI